MSGLDYGATGVHRMDCVYVRHGHPCDCLVTVLSDPHTTPPSPERSDPSQAQTVEDLRRELLLLTERVRDLESELRDAQRMSEAWMRAAEGRL